MKRLFALTTALALPVGFSQLQAPDPQQLAQLQATLRPVTELAAIVGLLVELHEQPELALDAEQAEALLPLLTDLQLLELLLAEEAEETLVTIEDEILTVEQLIWIDTRFLELEQEARERGRAGGFGGGGQGQGGGPFGGGQGQGPGRPGGAEAFQALLRGEIPNPFLREGSPGSRLAGGADCDRERPAVTLPSAGDRGRLGAMALILIVEDNPDIADTLELFLRSEAHRTERARDGNAALTLFRAAQPDLVLLDIGLPGLDGLEVLKAIRAESEVPVILLTARAEEVDELLGLGLGADDYITKPYSPRKLMARIKAALRRSSGGEHHTPYRVGGLEVDTYQVRASVEGDELKLTPTEFNLLAKLASAPGKAMSRAELIEAALPDSDALARVVDVHLKNVRRKLGELGADQLLETVRGVGYRLRERP